ncbi:MAG: PKD domain-containing protein, partial [Bacteroidota bacterium]
IISTSAACPDSGSVCEKVCEFTTATYEALLPGGASTPVDWQVQGAENFTASGNQLLVEWGAAGQGQVMASVGSSGGGGAALQLFCGQSGIEFTPLPGGLAGVAYVQTHDAVFPLTYTVTNLSTNVEVANGTTPLASFDIGQLPPGNYVIKILDAAGQAAQCVFTIVVNDSDCWVSSVPDVFGHASSCNVCDSYIELSTFGSGITGLYSYAWSTGSTTQTISNLCPGLYSVTVTENSTGCTDVQTIQIYCPSTSCSGASTLCVVILAKPEAIIASTPTANANDIIVVCQGQTVYFENQSTDATSYAWDFGDFNTSAQFEPSHVYPTPGLYNVMLIARNECFCSDTSFVEVYVLPANVPEIQCLGTVCEGESVTYTTSASCGSYTWVVSANSSILDGGGAADNFVTVQWNTGAEGTISLEVSGCAGMVCNVPNVIPIAILSDNVQIKGKDKVCQDATEEYFIPDFDGTDINWTVLGSGFIEDGQGTNRITVHWFGDANVGNPQHVIVEFNNCYLECSGRDTLPVFIVPQFYATGPIEICQNASGTYQSRNAINGNLISSNWQVFNQLGSLVWSSPGAANTANVPFSFPPGSYTVRAMPASASSFCNDEYDIFVKIAAPPAQPTSILGEDEICPGIPYSYEATGQAGNDFTWTIRNGFVTSTMNGNPVNVTWGASPPYSVSAAQIATTGLGCTGDTTTLVVLPIPDFSISGNGSVCREATETYSVPAFQNVDFQWTISPADAGTVISPSGAGGGSESVDVLWHRPGAAVLSVKVCGTTKTFNVTVNDLPEPFVADQQVCFGTTASITTAPVFANYDWRNEGGTTVSILANPNLGGGFYELEVTDANGCVGDTTFEIMELAQPNISISTPSYFALCSGGPAATIHAVVSGEGYDYAWTR